MNAKNTMYSPDVNDPSVEQAIEPNHIFAVYRRCGIPAYDDNRLIAALGPIRTRAEWTQELIRTPSNMDRVKELDSHLRMHVAASIKDLFVPDPRVLGLAEQMSLILRAGYVHRNPVSRRDSLDRPLGSEGTRPAGAKSGYFDASQPMFTASLFGISGSGKTTSVESILTREHQYIVHDTMKPIIHQVVWIKISMPRDGSPRDLYIFIVEALDRVLLTSHAADITREMSANRILAKIRDLAKTYALGLIVIDEIQYGAERRGERRDEVLKAFQDLINTVKVPVFLMGTFRAKTLFGKSLTYARRASIFGSTHWVPLEPGIEIDSFVRQLWKYQVLREPGDLTSEMTDVIGDQTQGVRSLIVDIYIVAQIVALRSGFETLTPEFFASVAENYFATVQPVIRILRSKDPDRLVKVDDACDYDSEEIVTRAMNASISAYQAGAANPGSTERLIAQAIEPLSTCLKISRDEAYVLLAKVAEGGAFKTSAQLTREAVKVHRNAAANK